MTNDKIKIELSDAQKKALRNERINGRVTVVFAVLGFVGSLIEDEEFDNNDKRNLIEHTLVGLGSGLTAGFFSSLFFPVSIKDVLEFKPQSNEG